MKATIIIPMKQGEAREALNAMKDRRLKGRVKTDYKASRGGLEIRIDAKDLVSLKAAFNTAVKLYGVYEEVKGKCRK